MIKYISTLMLILSLGGCVAYPLDYNGYYPQVSVVAPIQLYPYRERGYYPRYHQSPYINRGYRR